MSISLNNLPRILITQLQKSSNSITYYGMLDKLSLIRTGWLGFIIDDSHFISGKFLEINLNDATAVFQTEEINKELSENKSYPVLDDYWGERAKLVLDKNIEWRKVFFEPTDSIKYNKDGTTEVIKKGWDHEHCSICWQKISDYEEINKYGYTDNGNNWICQRCLSEYVEKRSLDFIEPPPGE